MDLTNLSKRPQILKDIIFTTTMRWSYGVILRMSSATLFLAMATYKLKGSWAGSIHAFMEATRLCSVLNKGKDPYFNVGKLNMGVYVHALCQRVVRVCNRFQPYIPHLQNGQMDGKKCRKSQTEYTVLTTEFPKYSIFSSRKSSSSHFRTIFRRLKKPRKKAVFKVINVKVVLWWISDLALLDNKCKSEHFLGKNDHG